PPYYDHPAFIDAFCDVARPILADQRPDKVLMSFHGIPQRHVRKVFKGQPERELLGVDGAGGDHCLEKPDCCAEICPANRNCYSAHCYATARSLAAGLELSPGSWEVSFQSRLGREPWLEPYTDFRIEELPGEGVEKLAVFSPAFTADCLETVEEIGLRARDDFLAAGGKDLRLIPSLNAESSWVEAVVRIVADTTLANEVQD
ncbi:MAG: ferrochelatase, partial [Planctomycetota bacterium]|nr:ferrochelatase [Planctomycetota bacterium]